MLDSTKGSVRRMWEPLVGVRFAELIAAAVVRILLGFIPVGIFYLLGMGFGALAARWWPAWILVALCVVAVGVSWLLSGRPIVKVSKELGSLVRAAGFHINHDPGVQSVIAYRKWLSKNNLSAADVSAIGDGRFDPPRDAR